MNSIACMLRTVGLIGLSGCCAAIARAGPADQVEAPIQPAVRIEVSRDTWPEMAGAFGSSLAVTRWGPGGRTDAGFSLGMQTTRFVQLPDGTGGAPTLWGPQLGVHWTAGLSGRRQVRFSGWTDLSPMGDGADQGFRGGLVTYTAQVQVQWQSARYGGLVPEYGAIGVQLQGGSRLLLRARHGGPMIYYRMRF